MTAKVLCEQFEIPTSLSGCGISEQDFFGNMEQNITKILEDACTMANPVNVNREDLYSLLSDIYRGE